MENVNNVSKSNVIGINTGMGIIARIFLNFIKSKLTLGGMYLFGKSLFFRNFREIDLIV